MYQQGHFSLISDQVNNLFLSATVFLMCRFMLSDPDIPVKEKAATDNERKVTFLNLVPGRLYNITLWTVSGGVTSRPLERQV